ncbi:MAG: hypothetical protein KDA79_24440, partial [Planctomycetaceae bacterium]|nr:hypothetical protein [Planctomycetaceae bacterium]
MLLLLAIVSVPMKSAEAQTRPIDRRDMVDDLLKSLIETETDRREYRRSTFPEPRATPAARVIDAPTEQMLSMRRALDGVSRDADRLATLLDAQRDRAPEVRVFLGDVLKLRARVSVLAQRARTLNDHRLLQEDLKALDREWRILAYRLTRIRGLSRETTDQIERLNQYAKAIGQVYEMDPQIDHGALLRQTATLTSDLQNLQQDMEVELESSPDRSELLLMARRAQQQADLVTGFVLDRQPYSTVVSEYQKFQRLWYPLSTRLRTNSSTYLERSVRRIRHADEEIHELLWIPRKMDSEQLVHLTNLLKSDVDEFFSRAPLKLLIGLPRANEALPTADQFYGVCEHFIDSVNRNESMDSLVDAYRYIDSAWITFHDVFRPLQSPAAQRVLAEIEHSVNSLRDSMQVTDTSFDRRQLLERAAALENLAEHMDLDTRMWLSRDPVSFRNECLQESAAFQRTAADFHRVASDRNTTVAQLQLASDRLYENWRRLYRYVSRCNTDDRAHLARLASQITPTLVEIRTQLVP